MLQRLHLDSTVLWWSGGLESTLLLALLRQQPHHFDIVQMRDLWTKGQRKKSDDLIKEWKLKVFILPSANKFFIGQGDEITLVDEYPVGNSTIPMLRDVVEGTQCLGDMDKFRAPYAPIKWDLHIVGSRKDDTHYAGGQNVQGERWKVGGEEFYAPLYHWTREEVIEKSIELGLNLDGDDTGNIEACSNCLKDVDRVWCPKLGQEIDTIKWDKADNLDYYRSKYGLGKSNTIHGGRMDSTKIYTACE